MFKLSIAEARILHRALETVSYMAIQQNDNRAYQWVERYLEPLTRAIPVMIAEEKRLSVARINRPTIRIVEKKQQ